MLGQWRFHITPRTPETREQLVTPRLCERCLAGDQPICTILAKKYYLPLVAKDGTTPKTLTASPCGSAIVS